MLDRTGRPRALRILAGITKSRRGRALGLDDQVRKVIEGRVEARRLDCPLIFHRVARPRTGRRGGGSNPLGLHGSGSSGRIRTYNPPVNSRMLYH
jgi:hypothetical protein